VNVTRDGTAGLGIRRREDLEFVDGRFFDHFMDPRNVGRIEDPDGTGAAGDPSCGDWLLVTIRVERGKIGEIRFLCRGCSSAIATSSAMTELAAGKSLEEALAITASEIEGAVGGLPEEKKHCSLLGEEALKNAVADYLARREKGRPGP
jgi:nitrogen fixation NifU-like protein